MVFTGVCATEVRGQNGVFTFLLDACALSHVHAIWKHFKHFPKWPCLLKIMFLCKESTNVTAFNWKCNPWCSDQKNFKILGSTRSQSLRWENIPKLMHKQLRRFDLPQELLVQSCSVSSITVCFRAEQTAGKLIVSLCPPAEPEPWAERINTDFLFQLHRAAFTKTD